MDRQQVEGVRVGSESLVATRSMSLDNVGQVGYGSVRTGVVRVQI